MKTQTQSNILPMPHTKSRHRVWAAEILRLYYAKKAKENSPPSISQSSIDSRKPGWEKESETTNARLARILRGEK